jgi:thymidylate synthase (FAD)
VETDVRVLTGPEVYLIGRSLDGCGLDRFLARGGAMGWKTDAVTPAQAIVEVAARSCYDSFKRGRPGGNRAHVTHLIEAGHGSCLEHVSFTLALAGISRSVTHELIRHRAGMAYSQRSQRFVDESASGFVLPPGIPNDPGSPEFRSWLAACSRALRDYCRLVEVLGAAREFRTIEDPTARRKAIRQTARAVLPNCVETVIVATGNVRAWRNVLEQRGSPFADSEIRRLAVAIYRVLLPEAPDLFADFRVVAGPDGSECLECDYHKV